MLTEIIKRDGRRMPYQKDKISAAIYQAAKAAQPFSQIETTQEEAIHLATLAEQILQAQFQEQPPTVEEIQDIVIQILLKQAHPAISQQYTEYRAQRSKVRKQKSHLMKTIHEITTAKDADIKKENANIDGNTSMGSMLQYGSAVSKEYSLNYVIEQEHADLHRNGDIHIHDLDFLSMGTLTCCQIDLAKLFKGGFFTGHGHLREPQDIQSYAALAAIAIQSNQNDQHGGQSIATFDYDMAEGVRKTYRKSVLDTLRKAFAAYQTTINKEQFLARFPILDLSTIREQEPALLTYLLQETGLPVEQVLPLLQFAITDAKEETAKKTYQAMEAFIHNLNTMHSRAGAQVPFSSVNFGTDTSIEGRMVTENLLLAIEAGLGNHETAIFPIAIFKVKEGISYHPQDPNYDLFVLACKVSAKRLFPNFSFLDAPFNAQYYKTDNPHTEVTYMGCRTRVIGNICGEEIVTGRGNISFTTINLPRLGIQYGLHEIPDLPGFYHALEERIDQCVAQLLSRYELQIKKKVMNFPFLMGEGVWNGSDQLAWNSTLEDVVKQGTLSIGFIGLAECLKALIGSHHGESQEAKDLGYQIISFMRNKIDQAMHTYQLNFSLLATPAEGLSGRFTRIDRMKYGKLEGITDRDYYTNSFHVPVYHKVTAYDKIMIEAPYHALTNAGHITYVELDGDPVNNTVGFQRIVEAMKEAGIGYGSVNHPVDYDPVCGYHGIIPDNTCPHCQRIETTDAPFERIRRITGYLVGTLERFNQAKRAEEKDRVKHA